MDRRNFIKAATGATAAALGSLDPVLPQAPQQKKMIGIQVGAVSFLDEGVEKVLDIFQERAHVNTLFLAVFTYSRGTGGRQVPGRPLPDHGKQEYDLKFRGGNFARVHPEYYKNTALKETRAPHHGDLDLLEMVLPPSRKRGIKTVCWLVDDFPADLPNVDKLQERNLYGGNLPSLCFRNPDHRNFWLALVEDYIRSYEIDGIMWTSERRGPLDNALSARPGGSGDLSRIGCFCEFCRRQAREQGINFERVREGFRALEAFVRNCASGKRPVDGHYVTFWRILLRYPELAAWEMFWTDGLRETYRAIYDKVKAIKPALPVGWHIAHSISFSPIYRAEQDVQELSRYSDFLKIVVYHNCAGERMASYIDSVNATLFGDVPKEQLLDFEYRVMQYKNEGRHDRIPFTGFSSDYVHRETKRAMEALAGTKTLLWPGIDIDIPTGASNSKSTPPGTRDAVLAALRAGAHGVVLSRKYSEMKLANLSGAGEAIRELGLA